MSKVKGFFLEKWKEQQKELLKMSYPEASDKQIEKFLDREIKENLKVPNAVVDNNHRKIRYDVDLLSLIDWLQNTKPIIAGGGTFFMNQNKCYNPSAALLDEFLTQRKIYKKQLEKYHPDSHEYKTSDRMQKTEKTSANAYYGGSGNAGFVFFNLYCATSTTSTAQSLISTTETAFEAFLANNNPFINLDDCFDFIRNVKHDKRNFKANFLPDITVEEVHERLINNFIYRRGHHYSEQVMNILLDLDQETLNRIYYKNNIYKFFLVPKIYKKMKNLLKDLRHYVDPNEVPSDSIDRMNDLWDYLNEFVFYNHFAYNRIQRLKYEQRKVVITVDTDSNFISLNSWLNFAKKSFYNEPCMFEDRDEDEIKHNIINTMCFFIGEMLKGILGHYTERSNILEEYKGRINMKNEFYYSRIALTKSKKRYAGLIGRREASILNPPKLDIKGHEFKKATCTEEVRNYMENIIMSEILTTDNIVLPHILTKIKRLEDSIIESLNKGEKKYYLPKQVKTLEEYKKPFSLQQFKATYCWNMIYPDIEITLPNNVYLIKLSLGNKAEMQRLSETYPDIYRKIQKRIIDNPMLKALETIAIPSNLDDIPQWIIDFTDRTRMVNDNVARFYPVLESLGIPIIKAKDSVMFYSNILKI